MAINAYTGLMGSGKSYEVVENVILPALLAGRRVVTNVADLKLDDINFYLVDKLNGKPDQLGQVVQVDNDDLTKPNFFPIEDPDPDEPSIVKPGDLVVVDECWRWWAAGAKISPAHMTFFRMHRHFVDPVTKSTCDLVLVVQDISDLDRKLKVVVENTYRMSKHKSLGSNTRYRVDVYTSYKTTRPAYRSLQRKYNPEIFALYSSYSQGNGKSGNEVAIDERANIFKSPFFRFGLPVLLVLFVVFVSLLLRFFNPKPPPDKVKPVVSAASSPDKTAGSVPRPALDKPDESSWRYVGHYSSLGVLYVLVSRDGVTRTLTNPSGWFLDTLRGTGLIDGQLVAEYTGTGQGVQLLPEEKSQ